MLNVRSLLVWAFFLAITHLSSSAAHAYTRINGGCQYFDLNSTYEKSDLVFIGFLTSNVYNRSEPIATDKTIGFLNDDSPVRVSRDLTFKVLQAWKGVDPVPTGDEFITVRERYLMLLDSRFDVGNTYLIFLNKDDEFGDEGWRLYECSKYENLGRGNAHYVASLLEKLHSSKVIDAVDSSAEKSVNPMSLGENKAEFN